MKIPKLFKVALLTVFFASTWTTGSASPGLHPEAANYYIDRNHLLASDGNPGSQSHPLAHWRHLPHSHRVGDIPAN